MVQGNIAMKREQKPVDARELIAQKRPTEPEILDTGKGSLKIWVIKNSEKIEYPEEFYGQFYSQDSYIVCMLRCLSNYGNTYIFCTAYKPVRKVESSLHIIYYWQGRECSKKDRGATALFSINLEGASKGDSEQVRLRRQPIIG